MALPIRLSVPEIEALDAFEAAEPDPKPSRPEAIRRALTDILTGLGYLRYREDPDKANGR